MLKTDDKGEALKIFPKFKISKPRKSKLQITKIIKITPCGMHAWVETDKGVFRKEIKNIPVNLLK
jgi:hypothetical protein